MWSYLHRSQLSAGRPSANGIAPMAEPPPRVTDLLAELDPDGLIRARLMHDRQTLADLTGGRLWSLQPAVLGHRLSQIELLAHRLGDAPDTPGLEAVTTTALALENWIAGHRGMIGPGRRGEMDRLLARLASALAEAVAATAPRSR